MKPNKLIIFLIFLSISTTAFGETSVTGIAKKAGIKKCLSAVIGMSDFIIGEGKHHTHASYNTNNPDNRMYSTLTSKYYSDGDSHVSIIVTPNTAGTCDAVYVETYALTNSCMVARENMFKEWKYSGVMNNNTIRLTNSDNSVDIYLTPQGESVCLVSKREMVYL